MALGVVSASIADCIEDRALHEELDAWFTPGSRGYNSGNGNKMGRRVHRSHFFLT